jgi:hypothetical protein
VSIANSREYQAIATHYGERTAKRSGVRLMRHIDQGISILEAIGASERAMRAFCLHPLVQADDDLAASYPRIAELSDDPHVIVLALEYRHIANATLSTREIAGADDISLSPLAEVNQMLVADKVQNRSDFLAHHASTHPRAADLARYFECWLLRLGIDEARYRSLVAVSEGQHPPR